MIYLLGFNNKLCYHLIAMNVQVYHYNILRCMCLAPHIENFYHPRGTLQTGDFLGTMICASNSDFYKLILKVLSSLRYYDSTFPCLKYNTQKRWVISEIMEKCHLGCFGQQRCCKIHWWKCQEKEGAAIHICKWGCLMSNFRIVMQILFFKII